MLSQTLAGVRSHLLHTGIVGGQIVVVVRAWS